jgi:hypothetical protein
MNSELRKSSYSSNGGANCVECGTGSGAVLVRDTTRREAGSIAFSAGVWAVFTAGLK